MYCIGCGEPMTDDEMDLHICYCHRCAGLFEMIDELDRDDITIMIPENPVIH